MSVDVVKARENSVVTSNSPENLGSDRRQVNDYEWLTEWLDGQKFEEKFWIKQIIRLVKKLSCKDIETTDHARRVASFSLRLGIQLGVSPKQLPALWTGSLLHDIGKIMIPDKILKKPGSLDDREWKVMRQHPRYGNRLLIKLGFPESVCTIAAQHHEHYTGNGYPYRLKESGIHLFARIFAVADTYDAITSNRCYRQKSSYETACEEIARVSGTQLDPAVVKAFTLIPENEWNETLLKQKGYLKELAS